MGITLPHSEFFAAGAPGEQAEVPFISTQGGCYSGRRMQFHNQPNGLADGALATCPMPVQNNPNETEVVK